MRPSTEFQSSIEQPAAPAAIIEPKPISRVLQVHKSFLVTQDEQGVVIIDQHALHERAMFEHLLERVRAGPLESQRLLTPAVVPATPAQVGKLDELHPLLTTLGIQAEPLGPRSVGVHAFPTFLFDDFWFAVFSDVAAVSSSSFAQAYPNKPVRIIVPLGPSPKRLDCARLYDLEIARLKRMCGEV